MRSRITPLTAALIASLFAAALAAQTPTALKFTELGHGPTVVFVHGLGGSRLQWMPTVRKLIVDHHIVLVDLPAHGETPMLDPFSFNACAAALDEVLAKQNAESTVVVAHGVGGSIALLEAGAHPGRMKGLIVIDASLKPPMAVPDQQKKALMEFIDSNFSGFLKKVYTAMARDSAEAATPGARPAPVPEPQMQA